MSMKKEFFEERKKIKAWFNYIEYLHNLGYTKKKIIEFLLEKKYNEKHISYIFNLYYKEKKIKKYLLISSIIFIFFFSIFIIIKYPNITGNIVNIIGIGSGNIYYVDPNNGSDLNNGLSINNAFKTLEYAFTKLNSGDILYLLDGIYYLNQSISLNNVYFNNAIMISAINKRKATIKANIDKFEIPDQVWQNTSINGLNIWSADYSTTDTIFIAYYNDTKINLFSYNKYNDFLNSTKPEGIFYNISNNKLLIRFKDIDKDPNKISLIISHKTPFSFNNLKGGGLILSNLNIEGSVKCVDIKGSDNIIIENNTCINSLKGFDIRTTSNISILNNIIYMKPGNFSWKDMKLSLMETSALFLENNLEDVNASYNTIYGYFNGILTYSTEVDKFFNIDVSYNNIYDIYDDAIEIEDYCNKGKYHHNNISNSFVGFSLSPARALQNKCYVYNNLIITDKLLKWDNYGNYYYGECLKL